MESGTNAGFCSRVVFDLMSGMEADGFHMFIDNYYASPQLSLSYSLYIRKESKHVEQQGLAGKDFPKISSKPGGK